MTAGTLQSMMRGGVVMSGLSQGHLARPCAMWFSFLKGAMTEKGILLSIIPTDEGDHKPVDILSLLCRLYAMSDD